MKYHTEIMVSGGGCKPTGATLFGGFEGAGLGMKAAGINHLWSVAETTNYAIIILVTHTDSGRFVFRNADGFNNRNYWAKHPLLVDNRPVVCVTTSAANKGCFVMTAKDGKPCKRCGTSEWYKWGHCVHCKRKSEKQRAKDNIENNRQRALDWQRNNPERYAKKQREWYLDNQEYQKEKSRLWRTNNLERARRNSGEWQRNNRDKVRKRNSRWKRNNKDKVNAQWHRRRTRKTNAGGSYTASEFKALCEQYNNRCLCCGKKRRLTADHVIPVSKGGTSNIDNIQPLCQSCNSSKGDGTTDYRTKKRILRWIQDKLF